MTAAEYYIAAVPMALVCGIVSNVLGYRRGRRDERARALADRKRELPEAFKAGMDAMATETFLRWDQELERLKPTLAEKGLTLSLSLPKVDIVYSGPPL